MKTSDPFNDRETFGSPWGLFDANPCSGSDRAHRAGQEDPTEADRYALAKQLHATAQSLENGAPADYILDCIEEARSGVEELLG